METWYTIKEIAIYLKVAESTVKKWVRLGKIKSYKIAGAVRIKESDLIDFTSKER
jgi:excisionase family DNA binding protein